MRAYLTKISPTKRNITENHTCHRSFATITNNHKRNIHQENNTLNCTFFMNYMKIKVSGAPYFSPFFVPFGCSGHVTHVSVMHVVAGGKLNSRSRVSISNSEKCERCSTTIVNIMRCVSDLFLLIQPTSDSLPSVVAGLIALGKQKDDEILSINTISYFIIHYTTFYLILHHTSYYLILHHTSYYIIYHTISNFIILHTHTTTTYYYILILHLILSH